MEAKRQSQFRLCYQMSALNGIGPDALVGIIVSNFAENIFLVDHTETGLTVLQGEHVPPSLGMKVSTCIPD